MFEHTRQLTRPGWVIVAAVACLYLLGLASIFASEAQNGTRTFTQKQLIFLVVGLALAWLVLRIGFQIISQYAFIIFSFALLLLIPPVVARVLHTEFGGLVPDIRGAHRWIRLPGFQLQPSEVMKVAYILALSWYLRYRKNYRTFRGLLLPFVGSMIPLVLILLEPDLGTVLLMVPVLFAMMYLAGARLRHLVLIAAIGFCMGPAFWMKMRPYQRLRVTSVLLQLDPVRADIERRPQRYHFLNEDASALRREARQWTHSSGMQLVRAKAALGSGGILGQGWGHGTYVEYDFLPDRHNDFVFALIGHQWGLLGCILVLACYTAIALAGAAIATDTSEPVGRLLASGVVVLISVQVLINVGMCVGLMPITGMTLPFVSYGGSSLLVNFIAIALLVSVGQHRPYLLAPKPFEHSARDPADPVRPKPKPNIRP
jgi:cell division protein FtsW (lipid II flippase)